MNFWNNFAAKHPAAAKWVREGGLFVIVSNLITVFKYLLLQFLPKAFASLPVVDFGWPGIDITLFGETFKWNILGYDAAHGGLPYFCAYMIAMVIGECINFPIQRSFRVPQQGQPGQADRLVCAGLLHHHLHRQLHQLHLGGGGWPAGAGLYLQHRHHRAQRRHLHGDLLLREQDHLPGGRKSRQITSYPPSFSSFHHKGSRSFCAYDRTGESLWLIIILSHKRQDTIATMIPCLYSFLLTVLSSASAGTCRGEAPPSCCARPFCRLKAPLGLSLLRYTSQPRTSRKQKTYPNPFS